jgi:uncharacterized protein YebE (UPF0316 family)
VTNFFQQHPDLFNWVILPLMIFCARICDVSLGTLRNIFLNKGIKKFVPLAGFFEVLIWLVVVSQIMKNLNNWMCYIGWAGGFATGTIVGMMIEERLALGLKVVRIITNQNYQELAESLKESHRGVTIIDGHGAIGPVKMIFTVVKRKEVKDVEAIIAKHHPSAFYSVEDITSVYHGTFMPGGKSIFRQLFERRK